MIGHEGLQLFIDCGQPVDNALVSALVKEVIEEKVTAMMALKPADGNSDFVKPPENMDEDVVIDKVNHNRNVFNLIWKLIFV